MARWLSSVCEYKVNEDRLPPPIRDVVLPAAAISQRVRELASDISRDFRGRDVYVVGILTGAFIFACDLIRRLRVPAHLDFISISRYEKRPGTGEVKILKDLQDEILGKEVLIVEDIVDTGLTLNYLIRNLSNRRPASLAICTLLDRPDLRIAQIPIRYVGFNVSSEFLVGYGLDFRGFYRHLPYIATMKDRDSLPPGKGGKGSGGGVLRTTR